MAWGRHCRNEVTDSNMVEIRLLFLHSQCASGSKGREHPPEKEPQPHFHDSLQWNPRFPSPTISENCSEVHGKDRPLQLQVNPLSRYIWKNDPWVRFENKRSISKQRYKFEKERTKNCHSEEQISYDIMKVKQSRYFVQVFKFFF